MASTTWKNILDHRNIVRKDFFMSIRRWKILIVGMIIG